MIITIGQTRDDKRKITKSFTGNDIQVQLKQPCNILSPVFIISWSSNYVHCNYLHCADLGRYYFINDITLLPGNRAELKCSVDVLMSYRDQIRGLSCMIARNADPTKRAKYIQDTSMMTESKTITAIYTAENTIFRTGQAIIDDSYVLQVVGGASEEE